MTALPSNSIPPDAHGRQRGGAWKLVKIAATHWVEDKGMRLAASLAFYTVLSLAPLLVLAVKAVGVVFSDKTAQEQVGAYLIDLMGEKAGGAAAAMIGPLARPGAGSTATLISVIVLLVSASAVFGELQDSLNTIWRVQPRPGRAIFDIIRERFLSFVLVLGVCFLLLVSLIVTTILAGVMGHLGAARHTVLWQVYALVVSFMVVTLLFALMFKYLPDAEVRWSDVWAGAPITGILFSIGKFLLGWYLARASTTSVYGAAGSLIAVLLYVYYSAQILFFGAELTEAHAQMRGA